MGEDEERPLESWMWEQRWGTGWGVGVGTNLGKSVQEGRGERH